MLQKAEIYWCEVQKNLPTSKSWLFFFFFTVVLSKKGVSLERIWDPKIFGVYLDVS